MKKIALLKVLNIFLLLLIINQVATGWLGPKLPAWAFETFHIGGATLLIFLVLAHLALNFDRIKESYFARH